jgi:hypothetical protein
MSTRDEGATRGAGNPTSTRAGDLPSAGPYTPPANGRRESGATASVVEPTDSAEHTDSGEHTGSIQRPHTQHVSTEHVTTERSGDPRDRVRWGPIWAGVLVVLTVFIVLQLLFFALGWLDLGFNGAAGTGATAGIVTGVLALIAFFVGGLLAGASTMWRGAGDGLLHGVLVWALSVLGILAIALIGGSALLGPLAQLAGDAAQSGAKAPNVNVDPAQVLNAARQSAGATALSLGLAVAAAAIGGTIGSKIWPGKKNKDTDVTRHDHRVA